MLCYVCFHVYFMFSNTYVKTWNKQITRKSIKNYLLSTKQAQCDYCSPFVTVIDVFYENT